MLDKTPLEMALEREGQIEYCDECEYVRVVDNTVFCGLSGKLLHPMMFLRGQGFGPARRCTKRKEAREMGLTAADLQRMGPEAQRQVMEKLGIVGKTKAPKYHNQPDSRGNLRFDSKKEARRYDELMLMLKAGQIRNLRLQQQYTLQESYITETGERVRAIHYVADFAYERPTAPDKYGTVFYDTVASFRFRWTINNIGPNDTGPSSIDQYYQVARRVASVPDSPVVAVRNLTSSGVKYT